MSKADAFRPNNLSDEGFVGILGFQCVDEYFSIDEQEEFAYEGKRSVEEYTPIDQLGDPTGGLVGEGEVYYVESTEGEDVFCLEDGDRRKLLFEIEANEVEKAEMAEYDTRVKEMAPEVIIRRRGKVVKEVSQVKISEKVLIFSVLRSGMCPWTNKDIIDGNISSGCSARDEFNHDKNQPTSSDISRSTQYRTIDAVSFFD